MAHSVIIHQTSRSVIVLHQKDIKSMRKRNKCDVGESTTVCIFLRFWLILCCVQFDCDLFGLFVSTLSKL